MAFEIFLSHGVAEATALPSTISRVDGTVEEEISRRRSYVQVRNASFDDLQRTPTRLQKVRFASAEELRGQLPSASKGINQPMKNQPSDNSYRTAFINPFSSEFDSSRKTSSSSDVSRYIRPSAFIGHRDTLARIKSRRHSQDEESSSALSDRSASTTIHNQPFQGHRDTLARLRYNYSPAVYIPKPVLNRLLQYLEFDDYKALRLTCTSWLTCLPRTTLPASFRMPGEILHLIYRHLSPVDFDAARHSCKSWFLASLDKRLLLAMLKKAGCLMAVHNDLRRREETFQARRLSMTGRLHLDHEGRIISDCHQPELDDVVSEEWLYSKRLACEARLSAAWKRPVESSDASMESQTFGPMSATQIVDFSLLIPARELRPKTHFFKSFNVSTCGRFLLLIHDKEVTVFKFSESNSIQPGARLNCGRQIHAASMDTSSGRYTLGVLLQGRRGMCWDLDQAEDSSGSGVGEPMTLGMHTDVVNSSERLYTRRRSWMHRPAQTHQCRATVHSLSFPDDSRPFIPCGGDADAAGSSFFSPETIWEAGNHNPRSNVSHLFSRQETSEPETSISAQPRPTAVYDNLGSPDDSPRSVAICPQRKCVAFGCKMGIELHWVDALTGGDLNRWFPLAAPSDYLYFLPQRPGDSTKKLRLISSAAGPASIDSSTWETTPTSGRQPPRRNGRRQSMTRLFFGNLPFPSAISRSSRSSQDEEALGDRQGVLRTVDCDHYRAVPLSDGMHMLFTDPGSGSVCLGSDAPLGGPTKLLRKIVLHPPPSTSSSAATSSEHATFYTAGQELSWGVRIVVAYSTGRVVLFNIPSDTFEQVRYIKSGSDVWDENAGVLVQSDVAMDALMARQLYEEELSAARDDDDDAAALMLKPFRSLQIVGVEIMISSDAVEDVAINCENGGLSVWIFRRSEALRLDIYCPRGSRVRRGAVMGNGEFLNVDEMESPGGSPKEKGKEKADEGHVRFRGKFSLDGAGDEMPAAAGSYWGNGQVQLKLRKGPKRRRSSFREQYERLQVEVLTDWRGQELLRPYVVFLD